MRDLYQGITEHAQAGKHRLQDARVLRDAVRCRGAMYVAGYAVECLLKTKLMRMFGCLNLRELEEELQRRRLLAEQATIFTHQLEVLLKLTGATDRLRRDAEHWRLFNEVNRWIPAWRYSADPSNADDAAEFVQSVERLARWIENNI